MPNHPDECKCGAGETGTKNHAAGLMIFFACDSSTLESQMERGKWLWHYGSECLKRQLATRTKQRDDLVEALKDLRIVWKVGRDPNVDWDALNQQVDAAIAAAEEGEN